jgi:hypothetical protein
MNKWLFTLWLLLHATFAAAQGAAQADAATAERLLKKSGLWQQLDGLATQVHAGMKGALAQAGAQPSAAEEQRLQQAVQDSYAVARLRASAQAVVQRELQPRHVAGLERWYDSALGKRITQIEEASAADTREPAVVMQQGQALLEAMPSTRRALINGIIEATKSAELLVDIISNTAVATHQGMASVLPQAPGQTAADLRAALAAQRPQMLENFTQYLMAAMAVTYSTVESPDLTRYAEFLRGESGRHFNDVAGRALDAALTEASTELGRRLPGTRDGSRT